MEMEKKSEREILRRIHLTRVLAGDVSVPFLGGRPEERGRIRKQDIIDLKILLNTCKSLEKFIYNC